MILVSGTCVHNILEVILTVLNPLIYLWGFPVEFQVEFDEMGKVTGVTSEGETVKAPKVVCDPSYLPNKVQMFPFVHIQTGASSCLYSSLLLFSCSFHCFPANACSSIYSKCSLCFIC
jgi:hypothetical protein